MIPHWLERTVLLVGPERLERLIGARVLVVGLGGVGSFAAEFLGRAGIGRLTLVDGDSVDPTNKNRQLVALDSTVGLPKTEVMRARLMDINPELDLHIIAHFQEPDDMERLIADGYDYVLDCIDSIQPKQLLIETCQRAGVRFISAMGAGGKTDPERVRITRMNQTKNCPFAQQIRRTMRRQGHPVDFWVVSSDEETERNSLRLTDGSRYKKSFYGTISFMPAQFGLLMAAHVIRELMATEP
jgi:tRNA A37 threonylcarbamoyladenosine dehydratase